MSVATGQSHNAAAALAGAQSNPVTTSEMTAVSNLTAPAKQAAPASTQGSSMQFSLADLMKLHAQQSRAASTKKSAPSASRKAARAAPFSRPVQSKKSGLDREGFEALTEAEKATVLEEYLSSMYSPARRPDDDKLPGLAPAMRDVTSLVRGHFKADTGTATVDSDGAMYSEVVLRWRRHNRGCHNTGRGDWEGGDDAPTDAFGAYQTQQMLKMHTDAIDKGTIEEANIHLYSPLWRCFETGRPFEASATARQDALEKEGKLGDRVLNAVSWAAREQITSHDGEHGASFVAKNRDFGSLQHLNGFSSAESTEDLFRKAGGLNESHEHVAHRMKHDFLRDTVGALGSAYTDYTKQKRLVIETDGHADNGRMLFQEMMKMNDPNVSQYELNQAGFYNTQVSQATLRVKTDANGSRTFVPNDSGKMVDFGPVLRPPMDGTWERDFYYTGANQFSAVSRAPTKQDVETLQSADTVQPSSDDLKRTAAGSRSQPSKLSAADANTLLQLLELFKRPKASSTAKTGTSTSHSATQDRRIDTSSTVPISTY